MDEKTAVAALAALAQGARLRVFRALVVAGPAGLTPSSAWAGFFTAASSVRRATTLSAGAAAAGAGQCCQAAASGCQGSPSSPSKASSATSRPLLRSRSIARWCASVNNQVRKLAPCGAQRSRDCSTRIQVSWKTSSACAASAVPSRRRTKRYSAASGRA